MTQIVLHHLEYSRSSRIIWLLEEMGVDYVMIRHQRHPKTFRAQDDLKAIHPLSKAPAIEINGEVMVESGAIIELLIERFCDENLAPPKGDKHRASYLEWLHFAEGTMAMPIILSAIGPRFGGLGDMLSGFIAAEVAKLMAHVEQAVKGQDFLVGGQLSGADINMAYLLEVTDSSGIIAQYPEALRYLNGLRKRAAYQKSLLLGGSIVFAK